MQSLARRLEKGGVWSYTGVAPAAQPFLAFLLRRLFPTRTILVVTDHLKTQETFQQDLESWLRETDGLSRTGPSPLFFYPSWEILPHETRLPHADIISERLEALVALTVDSASAAAPAKMIVTSAAAVQQRTYAPATLRRRTRTLARGDRAAPLDLAEWLEAQGYEPEAQVTQKGEMALRGGILDLYPPTSPWPVRLEFFGDELESLRYFDPLTQISRDVIPGVTIPPAGELGVLKNEPDAERGSLLDYLPRETIVLLADPAALEERAEAYAAQIGNDPFIISWPDILKEIAAGPFTVVELREQDAETDGGVGADPSSLIREPEFQSLEAYRPIPERPPELQIAEAQRREFFGQLHRWLRQEFAVHVFCNNDGERRRFEELWTEFSPAPEDAAPKVESNRTFRPVVHLGALARGFICDEAKLAVVTDAEIFGRYKIQRPRRLKSPHALSARSALDIDFTELEEGDLVVHVQHGIGRYLGLQNLPAATGGVRSDNRPPEPAVECLVIEYAPSDPGQPPPKLYVPVTEAYLVGKYVGVGKVRPPLNTLGGTRWKKAREQAERAVRDVAAEMLSIQAARDSQAGHAFAPDAPWQREFEAAFLYEETPDQMRAIQETKADMERARPMDRLICGDVGFGKTEVAIRAAFKAVMDGRQVAVLVPTTVLAQQHYNTFRERMADYPIRVELLSRFRTRRQQQRVIKDLAAGAVDIVIGTHRLIQNDVAFKDLGLVVVDEEQRFGVLHKEKFKRLRLLVDVLTLSATPIPRTLYLALSGARDMSTIQTPPHDRLPVETIVGPYDERTIRDAVQRELNRDGQVFFLHNRVATIHEVEKKLRALLPRARIVVGHGQMHSDELEEVMTRFVNGEADVLLSTTIIESGLDIPNANTIIIDRADRFGLSDLYQLRGRVGRYKHQAYAYLLLPRHARLLTDVRKRISAIRQYSTLGSGFKIAMRDLEIRGAGNLLGSEQSGHITAVGFELYCQLLKQSVATMKGETVKPRINVEVRLDFLSFNAGEETGPAPAVVGAESDEPAKPAADQPLRTTDSIAYLPHGYVTEPRHRIEIYRKLAQASESPALESLRTELRDRFGPLPPAVELLLQVAAIKILASARGVTLIETRGDKLMLTRNHDYFMIGGKFPRLTRRNAAGRLKEIKNLLLALS